jgi:hypothetical protein
VKRHNFKISNLPPIAVTVFTRKLDVAKFV